MENLDLAWGTFDHSEVAELQLLSSLAIEHDWLLISYYNETMTFAVCLEHHRLNHTLVDSLTSLFFL